MKTKANLIESLRAVAPTVNFRVVWTVDGGARWQDAGDWTEGENPMDWTPWQSEVRASAIVDGDLVTASTYLGGTWERAGVDPSESNPDISGYLSDMLKECAMELAESAPALAPALEPALDFIRAEIAREYAEQFPHIVNP